jgi:glycosyltransferase involved in cell wall biosynthesis
VRRKLFILVPSYSPVGPVKGAYALSNALVEQREVTLVSLKRGPGAQSPLDSRVRQLCLADTTGPLIERVHAYRRLLREAGGRAETASLSMGLSADVANIFCREHAVTCASVRGNLFVNYRHDYGLPGIPAAMVHLFGLRWMDRVVAMNCPMARQVRAYTGMNPAVIGNFVDEASIEVWRRDSFVEGALRFVFVGSLTERKKPALLVHALKQIQLQGVAARVDFVGNGPLKDRLLADIAKLGLVGSVTLHGFVGEPARILAEADVMVLPSLSEGISRAALEALHLGVPCVLRDADGNSELVIEGNNGALFYSDEDLPAAMLRAAKISRAQCRRNSILPAAYRQATAARQYLELLESIDG